MPDRVVNKRFYISESVKCILTGFDDDFEMELWDLYCFAYTTIRFNHDCVCVCELQFVTIILIWCVLNDFILFNDWLHWTKVAADTFTRATKSYHLTACCLEGVEPRSHIFSHENISAVPWNFRFRLETILLNRTCERTMPQQHLQKGIVFGKSKY